MAGISRRVSDHQVAKYSTMSKKVSADDSESWSGDYGNRDYGSFLVAHGNVKHLNGKRNWASPEETAAAMNDWARRSSGRQDRTNPTD